ncbi:MAG: hypothetical protein LBF08_06165 [Dysgonamonadaceae bacterium]|jgi:hypothetical protein|nr:hypothetical protein [Dysgonamonadaceae bacterium]
MDIIYKIYNDKSNVFKLKDIAMLTGETNLISLAKSLNYFVRNGKLLNPRKGIYAKTGYTPEELTCILYTPSYISMEYVLARVGIIFQYDRTITAASYLKREITVGENVILYRKFKGEILVNTCGIILRENNINIATTERAFLDILYLKNHFFFDNLRPLKKSLINKLLPIYNSTKLEQKVNQLFSKK